MLQSVTGGTARDARSHDVTVCLGHPKTRVDVMLFSNQNINIPYTWRHRNIAKRRKVGSSSPKEGMIVPRLMPAVHPKMYRPEGKLMAGRRVNNMLHRSSRLASCLGINSSRRTDRYSQCIEDYQPEYLPENA
jgi:hypothetical protein